MTVEKEFTIRKKEFANPEIFADRIIKYMVNKYQCKRDAAEIAINVALSYGWHVCSSPIGCIGVQTNYDRSKIYVGR